MKAAVLDIETKVCKACGEKKSKSDFYLSSGKICKKCKNTQSVEWSRNNHERMKEIQRKHYYADQDGHKAYRRKHYQEIRTTQLTYRRKYNVIHREQRRLYAQQYKKSHPEVVRTCNVKRDARIRGAGGKHTTAEWQMLCAMYGNQCLACGRSDATLTRDHVIPVRFGGANDISNIQPLCKSCNCSKRARTIDYRPNFYWSDWT